jgi:hypothetical protein
MKLHGLARVKNEADVIEEFVRHNLRFVDALTVVDNLSLDDTVPILEALRDEGLPVTVFHDDTLPKRQYETMTRFARASLDEHAWDFLFLLDADEFIKARDRDDVAGALATLPPGVNGLLPWFTYVPDRDAAAGTNGSTHVLERMRSRRAAEPVPQYLKCVVSAGFAAAGDLRIAQGNHSATNASGIRAEQVVPGVGLAHFPVRSVAQLQSKILLGWGAYVAMGSPPKRYGWHQRRLFERLELGEAWTHDDLCDIAARYVDADLSGEPPPIVLDPLPPVPVRYTNGGGRGLQLAARYIRQLADAYAARR